MLKITSLLLFFSLSKALVAQDSFVQGNTKMQIGDSIPEELWNIPLNVLNHPSEKETITLKDFSNKKLIILDFWATWCGSCISSFPKTAKLKEIYSEDVAIIPITSQKRTVVEPFLSNNDILAELNTWTVYGADSLLKFIEYRTLPHFSWIKDGVLISHSTSPNVNVNNIDRILNQENVNWKQKENIDKEKPFVTTLEYDDFTNCTFFKQGELSGAGKTRGFLPYDNNKVNIYFTNYTLYEIYHYLVKKALESKNVEFNVDEIISKAYDKDTEVTFKTRPATYQVIFPSNIDYNHIIKVLNLLSGYRIDI